MVHRVPLAVALVPSPIPHFKWPLLVSRAPAWSFTHLEQLFKARTWCCHRANRICCLQHSWRPSWEGLWVSPTLTYLHTHRPHLCRWFSIRQRVRSLSKSKYYLKSIFIIKVPEIEKLREGQRSLPTTLSLVNIIKLVNFDCSITHFPLSRKGWRELT